MSLINIGASIDRASRRYLRFLVARKEGVAGRVGAHDSLLRNEAREDHVFGGWLSNSLYLCGKKRGDFAPNQKNLISALFAAISRSLPLLPRGQPHRDNQRSLYRTVSERFCQEGVSAELLLSTPLEMTYGKIHNVTLTRSLVLAG